jgi:hypothetical protein
MIWTAGALGAPISAIVTVGMTCLANLRTRNSDGKRGSCSPLAILSTAGNVTCTVSRSSSSWRTAVSDVASLAVIAVT